MNDKLLKNISFGLLGVMVAVLAVATVIEKLFSTEKVAEWIYGAWWFVALWGIATLSMMIFIIRMKLYRRFPAFLLHCSFVVILLGGLVTYIWGERGAMHIRQNEIHNYFVSEDGTRRISMPFNVKMLYFDIVYHPGTNQPADYRSFVKVDDQIHQISMNKIFKKSGYRIYQMDYDSDEMGATFLVSHDPRGVGITYAGYLLLAIAMVWILFLRIGWKGVLFTTIPTILVWLYISQINPMTPVLRTPMLATHVSVIMVAYALLLFIALTGIVGLCSKKQSKRFYHLNSKLLYPALFLLTAGIFIGAVWANISWGRYWGWDAKETWALITMLVYSLPMHKENIVFFSDPRKFHLFNSIAFATVLMTFLGVTYLLGGIHSYM
ncbi:cytochrome c biogenesis protein CcsA [uncultured Proteiniphilum sp.]|uniref:cytochrome c biogenesis protein CcsA n=1 Tax=uncultured Proteiniphilum sp. TaxID=497637 RepID=UPI00262E107B|nr:cytochrome c biogenesis protein CcsA [uncultured Proteiniphilum sp.]